jgi:hypothetical protein
MKSIKSVIQPIFNLTMLLVMAFSAFGPSALSAQASTTATPLAAPTNTIQLSVVSARTELRAFGGAGVLQGATISTYKYIINIDNTGTTDQRVDAAGQPDPACTPSDPGYPGSCHWVSIAGAASSSPIYTQGDQADFASGMTLPDGKYLISVIADGYKLDGEHFTVPMEAPGLVTVQLQPFPLPDATVRAWVFEDISPTNSGPDAPAEHGLGGFQGHIADYIGEVTTDVYGNPLCTRYEGEDPATFVIPFASLDANMLPVPIAGTGGKCLSMMLGTPAQVASDPYLYTTDPLQVGMLAIPHVGPNRYALSAVPPDGSNWIQTTTLEGNHDWDAWVMEGATGLDTEFVVAGEPFPATFFGFVHPTNTMSGGTGEIKGVVEAVKTYVPPGGALGLPGTIWGGTSGMKLDHPINGPWISLSNLGNGDTAVYVAQGAADGTFDITGVPAGTYTLAYWDEPQDYILDIVNVTVADGEIVDMGILPLSGWWTTLEGYVFNDLNRNGIRDAGEPGLPNFPVAMKKRENSLMDRGAVLVTTDATGYYFMENAYPMTQWLVMEAYSDLYYTTGVTYQADNQPTPTTVLGAGVDVSVLPIIGLSGRLDWGVHAYDAKGSTGGLDPRNGGIVGTVSYDTTRNELDPRYAAVEAWQPGVPDLRVNLYAPIICGTNPGTPCDTTNRYELASDGSFAKGTLLNTYITETWERPTACVARDSNGVPLVHGVDEQVLPLDPNAECLEGPLMSVQFQTGFSTVDGNYGFGTVFLDGLDPVTYAPLGAGLETPITAADYLVEVENPNDAVGKPLLKFTKEEDINIFNGDQFVPQIPPPECAGPLHTVDVAGVGTDGYGPVTLPNGIVVPASTPIDNQPFADAGGTVYEGQQRPLCDMKLVRVSNGRSVAPTFNVFTDVPIPGRFWGLIVDDLNFSSDPKSLLYGEKAGVPFAPVGIYDWTNRLVTTSESDYNGLFDVLLPSTNRISCPTPSGVCANLYRFVGNDPGIPGRLNTNYKPQFRTIAAEFEAFPGLLVPADLAPTQMGLSVQLPGGQVNQAVVCTIEPTKPQLFRVSQPYVSLDDATAGSFTITGTAFGATQGVGRVFLDSVMLPITSWSNTSIDVSVPVSLASGPHQLIVRASNGQQTVNGLTIHAFGDAAFPSTAVLDNFNRADGGLGSDWSTTTSTSAYRILSNQVQVISSSADVYRYSVTPAYGPNQEAFFTFTQLSATAGRQGLILKLLGSNTDSTIFNPLATWIEVSYLNASNTVQVRTKRANPSSIVVQANIPAAFANGDQLGARARSDGTVRIYKNGVLIGKVNVTTTANPWPLSLAQGNGRIGVWFAGINLSNSAQFDNFGGGTVLNSTRGYFPNLFEVGPGMTFDPTNPIYDPTSPSFDPNRIGPIQDALDAAAASAGDDLVIVYPGVPDLVNPRVNPRGAYYENLIVTTPVKLQGVGPGSPDGSVGGSIIDGSAFDGDTILITAWRAKLAGLTWVGNQNVYEGAVVYLLAQSTTQYGSVYRASIDGFDIRGGIQQGQPNTVTQGGAIFANAYIRYLQVNNNIIESNSASYGTIRLGTPNLPAPNTSQHNEFSRIQYNRILANSGTNLAGAIGLFAGSNYYDVSYNDLCGNFSAEYGGAISVYGYSPNGRIYFNRIYYNASYDEGGGIFIAGELPADPATLSPGSGAVTIFSNLIQSNLANDDGGGLRFLMAGNYPMNVYNNMIVNNVSTHEGGGVALDDAPNVRFYNNTVMKNLTTATAVTSNGLPAPAGLSTGANSALLQATLPAGSPVFSNPLLFNNIFFDNRAGTRSLGSVVGLSDGDANVWDLGVADGSGVLAPDASNMIGVNPMVVAPYNTTVTFVAWRGNVNFIGAIMVGLDVAPTLLGNYHLLVGSPAINAGAVNVAVPSYQQPPATLTAPPADIDNQARVSGPDIGADEYR